MAPRLTMLAPPLLLTAAGGIFWPCLDSIAAEANATIETAAGLKTRVTLFENTQTVGREDRTRYLGQVLVQLVKLTDKVHNQASQITALSETIEAIEVQNDTFCQFMTLYSSYIACLYLYLLP